MERGKGQRRERGGAAEREGRGNGERADYSILVPYYRQVTAAGTTLTHPLIQRCFLHLLLLFSYFTVNHHKSDTLHWCTVESRIRIGPADSDGDRAGGD